MIALAPFRPCTAAEQDAFATAQRFGAFLGLPVAPVRTFPGEAARHISAVEVPANIGGWEGQRVQRLAFQPEERWAREIPVHPVDSHLIWPIPQIGDSQRVARHTAIHSHSPLYLIRPIALQHLVAVDPQYPIRRDCDQLTQEIDLVTRLVQSLERRANDRHAVTERAADLRRGVGGAYHVHQRQIKPLANQLQSTDTPGDDVAHTSEDLLLLQPAAALLADVASRANSLPTHPITDQTIDQAEQAISTLGQHVPAHCLTNSET
jgi:hypothetical protein